MAASSYKRWPHLVKLLKQNPLVLTRTTHPNNQIHPLGQWPSLMAVLPPAGQYPLTHHKKLGLQIPQILIWSSICGTCWKKSDSWTTKPPTNWTQRIHYKDARHHRTPPEVSHASAGQSCFSCHTQCSWSNSKLTNNSYEPTLEPPNAMSHFIYVLYTHDFF